MQRTLLILSLFAMFLMTVHAQESETDFPDIIGRPVPEAEALLNEGTYLLDPVILSTNVASYTNSLNTVDDFEIIDGNRVRVTVFRDYNIELIWDNSDFFAEREAFRSFEADDIFTLVNLSDEELALENIMIGSFSSEAWLTSLPPEQCAQIRTSEEHLAVDIDECGTIRDLNVSNITEEREQFWRGVDSFDVFQNGIYRASCQVADGRCQLWLSPLAIAEDLSPYIYLTYDDSELIIYNNSTTQWMDLDHLSIAGSVSSLSDSMHWDYMRYPEDESFAKRLAPGQCARFTLHPNRQAIEGCTVVLRQDSDADDVFWTADFNFLDLLDDSLTLNCPASSKRQRVCLLARENLD